MSELLVILREEGYENLPKTAQTLFGTNYQRTLQQMQSAYKTGGKYINLGIQESLQRCVTNRYKDNAIDVFIHVDGAQIFSSA